MAEKKSSNIPDPKGIQANSKSEFIQRGWLYYNQNIFSESTADFRKALELDPQDINTLYALGLSLKALGEKEEAKGIFRQVIEQSKVLDRTDRSQILKTLAVGQWNQIDKGTW